jgi:flagellar operon protein
MGYRVINGNIVPVEPIGNISRKIEKKNEKSSFNNILNKKININESFVISAHAFDRLKNRNITLNKDDMKAINEGINKANAKGCKDSVIFYKDTAYVTSIKNRTVITAVDKSNCKENIFTNIDSVVVL